jgi:hypothetical protein
MFAAFACVIHCLAIPVISVLLISDSFFLGDEIFHVGLGLVALVAIATSVWRSYPKHRSIKTVAFGVVGVVLIFSNILMHMSGHDAHGHEAHHGDESMMTMLMEEMTTVIGGILVMIYHLATIKLMRTHRDGSCS